MKPTRDIAALVVAVLALHLGVGAAMSRVQSPSSDGELRLAYAGAPETWPRPDLLPGAAFEEFAPLPPAPEPADNPTTPQKAALGQKLFDDPNLSASGQIACASCHARELGFADGLRTSFGHDRQRGRRNAPSVATAAWATSLFWDGRASTLEEQSLHPIVDGKEMAAELPVVTARIAADAAYAAPFAEAFGTPDVTTDRIARALAAFQRTLKPRSSRYARFLGGQANALNDQQLRGLHLFRTKAGCANCHSGPLLSDQRFHNLGLHFYGRAREDLGRYEVTRNPADVGAFRTPSLLNMNRTGPWMHNGLFPTLDGLVAFYNGGGARPRPRPEQVGDPLFPTTDALVVQRSLTRQEREDLIAFLEAL
ncbi:cytochrome-c peroxidase [Brevundimonas sp.]|uniref:cytochrome-c peroxidase n=1 Tax=Brevundimonas sp. TaxID=1871086 RepID=UPI0037C07886